jgi:hypothetical protein
MRKRRIRLGYRGDPTRKGSALKTLFHYCPTSSFVGIVEGGNLRLSSLSLANDSMEGLLVSAIVDAMAQADGLVELERKLLGQMIGRLNEVFTGLGFCLSEEGDLLSQWRAYAADGTGVSVGFSKEHLTKTTKPVTRGAGSKFALTKVEYKTKKQEALVRPAYENIRMLVKEGAFRSRFGTILSPMSEAEIETEKKRVSSLLKQLGVQVLLLFPKLYVLKSASFQEEREWRVLSHFVGGFDEKCSFRASNDRIIPYQQFPLDKDGCICEIVLGPRHLTPEKVVKDFLADNGFRNVRVLKSACTYR